MNTITINGVTITAGRSIVVSNGKITIDGNDVTPDSKTINIEINGNIESIKADACQSISVTGSVTGSIQTQSGDVNCGDIGGNVSTMSGDVKGSAIAGNCSTMSGDIRGR